MNKECELYEEKALFSSKYDYLFTCLQTCFREIDGTPFLLGSCITSVANFLLETGTVIF